ncbi:MAG TPA: hypothetical protein DCF65_03330 [Chloroflexi bacterium]|nr:hypothetical protein [Chloroflexota bacterium]
MPNLNHIWQRFLLASSLLIGLAIGVAATIFGYSNLTTVDVNWSVIHIDGVPLWTVAVVPVALTLIAGTLYHWMDSLHHFTEHMRHRHRVHELEAEVASLRAHLDQVLEMPDHASLPAKGEVPAAEPVEDAPAEVAAQLEPESTPRREGERTKRVKLAAAPEPATVQANGEEAAQPAESAESEPAAPAAGT